MHTTHAVLQKLSTILQTQYPHEEAQSIAWELLRYVTHKSRIQLLMEKSDISNEQLSALLTLMHKHLNEHVPIAYLTGEVLFGDLTLTIRPPILIPRSETESWCYELIERLEPLNQEPLRILDLCTGSGCIALALAHALPQATVIGVDINPDAVALAEENRKKLSLNNCSFIQSDLFGAVRSQTFDIIVSNPPYIGASELASLAPSVRNFESHQALIAEDKGYALIKKIIVDAPHYLQYNKSFSTHAIPQLLIEIGHTQGDVVNAFMQQHRYANIALWKDYQSHNRVICAQVLANDTDQYQKT